MKKIFKRKNIILLIIILLIVFISYFFLFKEKSINCLGKQASWISGAESVPEYLNFTKNLKRLTDYLDCECADYPFCYSCRYDSTHNTYIYYYDDKFIVPPYEYTIEDKDIKKQNLSINEEGYHFLFNSKDIDLNSIKDGKINQIISEDNMTTLEITSTSNLSTGQDYQSLNFKIVDDGSEYKIVKKVDKHEECGQVGDAEWKAIDEDNKNAQNEMIKRINRCRANRAPWKYEVYVYREGMNYDNYRIDYIMDEIYFTDRKKVLKNLNALDKFENQLFDIYLRTNRIVPDNNEDFVLKKENSIQDIYKIIEKDKDSEKSGVFVYRNNFLVGVFGGEYYGIEKYFFEGKHKGLYCKNTWAIGGGGDTNSKCKIPEDAVQADEYIELIKEKCNE